LVPYQRVHLIGTKGRIEVEIPVNSPNDQPTRILIDKGAAGSSYETFAVCDQYTLQGDAFSRAAMAGAEAPVSLENAIANMAAIEAIFRSARSGVWEELGR